MKKSKLANFKNSLSRDEMKKINGSHMDGPYCLFNACITFWSCCSGTWCRRDFTIDGGSSATGVCLF